MSRMIAEPTRSLAQGIGCKSSARPVPIVIGVNAEWLANGHPDGIPRSSFGLVREMLRQDPSVNWILFTPTIRWPAAAEELLERPNCRLVTGGSPPNRLGRVAWRLIWLPRLAGRHSVDLLFNPVGNGPAWMPRGIPLVITIHDLGWANGRQWYSRPYRVGQQLLGRRAARLASHIIAVSKHSAGQIEDALHVGGRRITVVPNAVEALGGTRETAGRPKALFVGTLIRRKNLAGAWRALNRVRAENGLDVELVVAGELRDSKAVSPEMRADPSVRLLGYVDARTLAGLYRSACFLVLPSFEEGFGLPVLEAMASGTPVITSSKGALAEVAGDAALLVDPHDDDQIYQAMVRLFTDEPLRAELRNRGFLRIQAFSWEASARIALQTIALVAAKREERPS